MNNILSILTGVAMIGASALTMEGINKATDGGFYLASVKYLAEASPSSNSDSGSTAPAPIPSSDSGGQSIMPLQPNSGQQNSFGQQFLGIFGENQKSSGDQLQMMGNQQKNQQDQFKESQNLDESGPTVDPRQVQQSLNDINRFRSEIKNTIRQVKKQASASELEELNNIVAEVNKIYSTASNSSDSTDTQEAIQSFYENGYHDKVNNIRMRTQIPQELKQFQQSFKRVDKILQTKAVQSLGLNIDKAKQAVAEMKQGVNSVQSEYSAGNYDDAQSNLQDLHDIGQPGDIESTIARVRDIKNTLKRIRDAEVKTAAEKILQEVVDKFNNSEYRDARETLDEYSDDLMKMVNQFARAKTLNRNTSKTQIKNLGNLIEKKLQEIDVKQGQVSQQMQIEPQVTPAEPAQ